MNEKSNIQKNPRSVKFTAESHQFSGPIPHPEILRQYDLVNPGFAERIIRMAEKESENRHQNETRITKNMVRTTFLGITFAFLSVIIVAGLVYYSLSKGFDTTAATISVGSMAAVAGVFIFFKRSQRETRK